MIANPDVSVIIVNYNVRDLLLTCLDSLYSNSKSELQIQVTVIDNNSDDGSSEAVKSKFPDVEIIQNTTNAGFPAANNQGINIARGKYLLLLNPDTEFVEDSIAIMKGYLEENSGVKVLAPQLLNTDRSIQKSVFRFPEIRYILAEMFYLGMFTRSKYYAEKDFRFPFEIDSAAGAALFFRRKLINEIGMLNEKLFWIEDVDFCYRVKKAGGKVLYFPFTRIVHHSGQSAKKNYNISISNQVVNKIKFYKVHGSGLSLAFIYLLSFFHVFTRLILFGLLSPFKRTYFLKWKAYWHTFPLLFTASKGL